MSSPAPKAMIPQSLSSKTRAPPTSSPANNWTAASTVSAPATPRLCYERLQYRQIGLRLAQSAATINCVARPSVQPYASSSGAFVSGHICALSAVTVRFEVRPATIDGTDKPSAPPISTSPSQRIWQWFERWFAQQLQVADFPSWNLQWFCLHPVGFALATLFTLQHMSSKEDFIPLEGRRSTISARARRRWGRMSMSSAASLPSQAASPCAPLRRRGKERLGHLGNPWVCRPSRTSSRATPSGVHYSEARDEAYSTAAPPSSACACRCWAVCLPSSGLLLVCYKSSQTNSYPNR